MHTAVTSFRRDEWVRRGSAIDLGVQDPGHVAGTQIPILQRGHGGTPQQACTASPVALYPAVQIGRSDRGHQVSLAASLVLLGAMGPRYLRTRKAMPAGVMSVAAIASAVYQGRKTWEWL